MIKPNSVLEHYATELSAFPSILHSRILAPRLLPDWFEPNALNRVSVVAVQLWQRT